MIDYQQYETERLILRPTNIEDAEFVFELLNSPKWIKYIGDRNVRSVEEAAEYIKVKMLPQLSTHGYSNNTVIRKSDGVKMGSCGLYDREGMEGVDIGYAFLERYEGCGYAIEAALKVKELATTTFGINHLKAITTEDNLSSQKLLNKLDFRYVERINLPNDPVELLLYEYKHLDA